jgi:hypothetical protein
VRSYGASLAAGDAGVIIGVRSRHLPHRTIPIPDVGLAILGKQGVYAESERGGIGRNSVFFTLGQIVDT